MNRAGTSHCSPTCVAQLLITLYLRPSAQQPQHPPPSWGSSSQPSAHGSPDPASYPNFYASTNAPVDRHATSQAFAPYYGHDAGSSDLDDGWQEVGRRGRRSNEKPIIEQPQPIRGYDLDEPPPVATPLLPEASKEASQSPQPVLAMRTPPPAEPSALTAALSSPSNIPRPPPTQSGSPLDPGMCPYELYYEYSLTSHYANSQVRPPAQTSCFSSHATVRFPETTKRR